MKFIKYLLLTSITLLILGFTFLSFYSGPAIELDTAGQFDYAPTKEIQLNQFEKRSNTSPCLMALS